MTSRGACPSVLAVTLIVLTIAAGGLGAAQAPAVDPAAALIDARRLINEGNPRAAIERLTALDADRAEVAHLLGVAYYHADDYVHAIERLAPTVARLSEGSLERKEAVQVLGLSLFLSGRFADAVPLLEATRVWAAGNLELAYTL